MKVAAIFYTSNTQYFKCLQMLINVKNYVLICLIKYFYLLLHQQIEINTNIN